MLPHAQRKRGGSVGSQCRIELFGGMCVRQGGRAITRFRAREFGSLLAYLAYHLPHPQPRDWLVDLFWPDAEPEAGGNNLRVALSSLRRQLARPAGGGAILEADREFVRLVPAAVATDV